MPRGTRHSFTNVGAGVARMLFMYSPAGMDGMFAEIGTPGTRGVQGPPRSSADIEAMVGVASKYRFSIGESGRLAASADDVVLHGPEGGGAP